MKSIAKSLEDLVWVTQLGLSLMMPLLLLMGLCYWLTNQMGVGNWVYLPGFLFGLGAGVTSFFSFWKMLERRNAKQQKNKKKTVSFNRHE